MHISLRQPCEITSRFGDPNFIPYKLIDGNDVIKIIRNSKELIDGIRNGNGPAILELVTLDGMVTLIGVRMWTLV